MGKQDMTIKLSRRYIEELKSRGWKKKGIKALRILVEGSAEDLLHKSVTEMEAN